MKTDRLTRALRKIAGFERLDYFALYPATVLKDHGDMTVDLEADDSRIGQLTRVQVWLGLPGVTALEVSRGARVLLGFQQGHPDKHYADLWRGGGLKSITLASGQTILMSAGQKLTLDSPKVNLGGEGGVGVARIGSHIEATIPAGIFLVAGAFGPTPSPAPVTITGTVTDGSEVTLSI